MVDATGLRSTGPSVWLSPALSLSLALSLHDRPLARTDPIEFRSAFRVRGRTKGSAWPLDAVREEVRREWLNARRI